MKPERTKQIEIAARKCADELYDAANIKLAALLRAELIITDSFIKLIEPLEKELDEKHKQKEELIRELVAVLDKLARLGNEPHFGNSIGNNLAQGALLSAKVLGYSPEVNVK